jgi:uncharacterized protein YcnI
MSTGWFLRAAVCGALAASVAVHAGPAGAHTGFDPDEAAPGSVVSLTLQVAHEREGVGFDRVELVLPEGVDVPVVETPAVPGWTVAVEPATAESPPRVVWTGGPAGDDAAFPLTIGPVPAEGGRLQFRVLQFYADGTVDRWIEDAPAGGPEPEFPGPVLDLVAGGPGSVPPPTTAGASTTGTTGATTTTGAAAPRTTNAPADDGDDSGGGGGGVALAAVAVAAAAAAYPVWRRRTRRP